GLFALALLSKAMAVSLPVVLLILDVYPLRRLGWGRGRWLGAATASVLLEKIPFVALSGAASLGAVGGLVFAREPRAGADLRWIDRLALAVYDLAFYLWKTLVPERLSPLYELRGGTDFRAWPFLLSGLAIALLVATALGLGRRRPALGAVLASYMVMLLP